MFNVVCGDRDTGRALVAHPDPGDGVDHRERPGRHGGGRSRPPHDLKRVHLELGGKAPVIVFDDADLASRRPRASPWRGYFNAGQDCTAATRVLAGPGSTTTSSTPWSSRPAAQTVGGPDDDDADYGPLNSATQLARVERVRRVDSRPRRGADRGRAGRRARLLLRADGGGRRCIRTTR